MNFINILVFLESILIDEMPCLSIIVSEVIDLIGLLKTLLLTIL